MIDIKFLRENPEVVKQNIRNKFQDQKLPLVDEVIDLDARARAAQQEADELRASRNKLSKEIGKLMGQGKRDEAEAIKAQVSANADRLAELEATEKDQRKDHEDHDDDSQHHRPFGAHRKGRFLQCGDREFRGAGGS